MTDINLKIVYDFDQLGELTQKDLLVQLCIRSDRHFTKGASDQQASQTATELAELVESQVVVLRENGFDSIADQLIAIMESA